MLVEPFAQNVGKLKNYLEENKLEKVADKGLLKKLTATGAHDARIVLVEAWEKEVKEEISSFLGVEKF